MSRETSLARHARVGDALAFLAPLVVYALTLPSGLTWAHDGADGGDLIAAAQTLGIPHPPGYPLYTLLARAFLLIPWGTPAHRVALLSAVAGAAAAWLLFRLCVALLGDSHWPAALAAALLWAFAPIPWGQSVIAEVYSVAAALTFGFLLFAVRWRQTSSPWDWRLAWLFLGLGLAHQPLIAIFLVPMALWLWERRRERPLRPAGRRWLEAGGAVSLGLLFYVYLPIRAAASPAVNWGDPRTLGGSWWIVSAAPYRHLAFSLPLAEWPARISAWAGLMVSQFKVWGVALGLWGATAMHERDRGLSWGLLAAFVLTTIYAIGYNTTDSYVYLIPALAIWAAWVAFALGDLWYRVTSARPRGRVTFAPAVGAVLVLAGLPVASLAMDWGVSDLSGPQEAQSYVDGALAALPADGVVLATGDQQTFALWYVRWALLDSYRGEVISMPLLQFDWYRQQVQHRNPDLILPSVVLTEEEAQTQLVMANLDRWPIFLTSSTSAPAGSFTVEPNGPLYQVQRP